MSHLVFENRINPRYHILKLRKYTREFSSEDPWASIKQCFQCEDDNAYIGSILIIDGLDEVCVLNRNFNGQEFVEKLYRALGEDLGRSIRVIVTSRMGYFKKLKICQYAEVATIQWDEGSVNEWCDSYCRIHENRTEWCDSFKKKYSNLDEKDKRRDVFCSPLILYICCVSQIDMSKYNSVSGIYDEAFRVIGKKEYHVMNEETEKEVEINRQFTKEIAFQMFLNEKLDGVLENDWLNIAKEKTVQWGRERYGDEDIKPEFKKIFTLNHFAFDKCDAVEFAHKTVGEYFTAVKIYEDFFECVFKKIDTDISEEIVEDLWRNIFNAFRYKKIPVDIMNYLVELLENEQSRNWKLKFFKSYYIGMDKQLLFSFANEKLEHLPTCVALLSQVQLAFRNLTWLLTGLGFDNGEFDNTENNLEILASYVKGDVNLSGWKNLNGIDFSSLNLTNSNFSRSVLIGGRFCSSILNEADFYDSQLQNSDFSNAQIDTARLEEAHLENSVLQCASFYGSNLKNVKFENATLYRAEFQDAKLQGANFKDARLQCADFENAYLEGASFEGAHLEGVRFEGAHLEGANF